MIWDEGLLQYDLAIGTGAKWQVLPKEDGTESDTELDVVYLNDVPRPTIANLVDFVNIDSVARLFHGKS